jgi:hypothetical protein
MKVSTTAASALKTIARTESTPEHLEKYHYPLFEPDMKYKLCKKCNVKVLYLFKAPSPRNN